MQNKRFFFLPYLIFITVLTSFVEENPPDKEDNEFVVVLDAGHGGHDPGNLGNGYLEKNIALNIVLKAGELLEQRSGIKVIYTRKDDTFVDLYVRGEIANKANADLFVSVHCDSHTSDASGAGTFVLGLHANEQNFEIAKKENSAIYLEDNYETRYAEYDINSPESVIGLTIMQEEFLDQSIMLAKMMQDNFANRLKRTNRKVKQAGFIVLHQTFMPSVLVETGFLTNKSEGIYLNSKKGQAEMGKAIADAIAGYKDNVRANVPETSQPLDIVDNDAHKQDLPVAIKSTSDKAREESKKISESLKEPVIVPKDNSPVKEEIAVIEKEIKTPQMIEEQTKESIKDTLKIEVAKKETHELPLVKIPEKEEEPVAVDMPKKEEKPKVNIVFKVQILASSRDLPLRPENFHGLNRLSKEPYKNLYRYMYGITNSYTEAELLKSNAHVKGYTTAYIVAYKDKERIPVRDALKYVQE